MREGYGRARCEGVERDGGRVNPASEHTANTAEKGKPAPIATDPWDGLRVGSITQGVEAMPLDQRRSLLQKVPSFDAFGEDNDPTANMTLARWTKLASAISGRSTCTTAKWSSVRQTQLTPPSRRGC